MKATAQAHPIQGLVKYHGMRNPDLRLPYHDSISVCTAPSRSVTTVEFDKSMEGDIFVIDGQPVEGRAAERISAVVDRVRELAGIDLPVRFESQNSFRTNVGFGSSSSGFAAAAMSLSEAAGLNLSRPEISTIARRGSSSAARAVTGGFSHLRSGKNDRDCRSERIDVSKKFESDLRIIAGLVPAYKETEEAHAEAADSHMFSARLAHIHEQIVEMRDALFEADFDRVFNLAEHDSLSLAATTMTGPAGWVYWQPETLEIFETVRQLREEAEIPVYFSVDTGASVYVNTTKDHADRVEAAVADCGVETRKWRFGGPAQVINSDEALF